MPTLLWNRTTQNLVFAAGKAKVFKDSADADLNPDPPVG